MGSIINIFAFVSLAASVIVFSIGVYKDAKRSMRKMDIRREHANTSSDKRVAH